MTAENETADQFLDRIIDDFAADCGELTRNAPANVAKLRDACAGSKPSAGHTLVDEVCGLLRVAQGQRDSAEAQVRAAFDHVQKAREDRDRAVGALLCAAWHGCLSFDRARELLGMSTVQLRAEAKRIFDEPTP